MANGLKARGEFLELIPDRRVVFTWGWVDHPSVPPGSSTVDIDLPNDGEGTMVRLTHRGLPTEEMPIHTSGWGHYLLRLASVAEGVEVGPDPGPS